MEIALIAILVFFINIPFGYWRKKEKRFSLNWFLAIHIPVAIAYFLRYLVDINYTLKYILLFVMVFILGQYTGKILYSYHKKSKVN